MHVIRAGDRDITSVQAAISQKLCTQKQRNSLQKSRLPDTRPGNKQKDTRKEKKKKELQRFAKSSSLRGMLILNAFGWENVLCQKTQAAEAAALFANLWCPDFSFFPTFCWIMYHYMDSIKHMGTFPNSHSLIRQLTGWFSKALSSSKLSQYSKNKLFPVHGLVILLGQDS